MLNVLNPHELLAEEVRLPTTFKYGAVGVAKGLDAGATKADVPRDATVNVPLWLSGELQRRGMAHFDLPDVYKDRYRRKMNAGAECVSLRNRSPYFYEVGVKCNCLLRDVDLSAHLAKTFKTRYQVLISKGLNTMTGEEVLELHGKLSHEEQALFEGGRASIVATEKWLQNTVSDVQLSRAQRRKRSAAIAAGDANKHAKH